MVAAYSEDKCSYMSHPYIFCFIFYISKLFSFYNKVKISLNFLKSRRCSIPNVVRRPTSSISIIASTTSTTTSRKQIGREKYHLK